MQYILSPMFYLKVDDNISDEFRGAHENYYNIFVIGIFLNEILGIQFVELTTFWRQLVCK